MSQIIDRLHAEHQNLERLVRLLGRQPSLPASARFAQLHQAIAREAGCGCDT